MRVLIFISIIIFLGCSNESTDQTANDNLSYVKSLEDSINTLNKSKLEDSIKKLNDKIIEAELSKTITLDDHEINKNANKKHKLLGQVIVSFKGFHRSKNVDKIDDRLRKKALKEFSSVNIKNIKYFDDYATADVYKVE